MALNAEAHKTKQQQQQKTLQTHLNNPLTISLMALAVSVLAYDTCTGGRNKGKIILMHLTTVTLGTRETHKHTHRKTDEVK